MSNDVSTYYILVSSVVFYYDFALTMPQEIKYIWSSKRNLMNSLVITLRYITALGYGIPVFLMTFVPVTSFDAANTCLRNGKWPGIIGVVCQGLTLIFLIIRLFAIYDKKRWILYVTVPFGLLNVILSGLALGTSAVVDVGGLVMTGGLYWSYYLYFLFCTARFWYLRIAIPIQVVVYGYNSLWHIYLPSGRCQNGKNVSRKATT